MSSRAGAAGGASAQPEDELRPRAPPKTRSKRAGVAGGPREAGSGRPRELGGVEVMVNEEAICRELQIQATFRKYAPGCGSSRVIG